MVPNRKGRINTARGADHRVYGEELTGGPDECDQQYNRECIDNGGSGEDCCRGTTIPQAYCQYGDDDGGEIGVGSSEEGCLQSGCGCADGGAEGTRSATVGQEYSEGEETRPAGELCQPASEGTAGAAVLDTLIKLTNLVCIGTYNMSGKDALEVAELLDKARIMINILEERNGPK